MRRTIYCYHKDEENNNRNLLGKSLLFKIGDTTKDKSSSDEAAKERIEEQDSTSDSEPLIMDFAYEIPENFMPGVIHIDKVFHNWLAKKHNIYKYRKDKDREWYSFKSADEIKEYLNDFIYGVHKKNNFKMRPCQRQGYDKIVKYYLNNSGEFLLAAKMRYGKNFVFLNAIKYLKYKNVLVLTYKPGVFDSLEDDVNNHIYFNNFKYISYKSEREDLKLEKNKVNIVACSAQMAGYKYNEETGEESFDKFNQKNLDIISKYNWDIIITDECHYGTTTLNFKRIYDTLKCKNILYISGTPFKTIAKFKEDQLFMYTYTDEQNTPGNKMAKLYQYGIKMDSSLIKAYKKYKEKVDYPTLSKLFHANSNGDFDTPEVAKPFIDYMLTKDIYKVNGNVKHIFAILDNKNAVKACVKYINEKYYDKIFAIDGSNEIYCIDDLKELICKAISDNKMSITFSCGRFIEGTTIPQWNCVIMLNDGTSPERFFQGMFRGQSPEKGKTKFFVIDYNPERLLCMNHYIINELPTDKKSNRNISKQNNIKEWLKAAPIIVFDNNSDQTQIEISYKEIENVFFHNDRIGANKMTDSSVFNRIQFIKISNDDLNYILQFKGKIHTLNKDVIVNTNELEKGKNRVSITNTEGNKIICKNKKPGTISELIIVAKYITKFLPRYCLAYNCKTINDIINSCKENKDNNLNMFYEYTKRNFDIFTMIINANVINEDGINNVINDFWDELEEVQKMDAIANDKFDHRWNIYK